MTQRRRPAGGPGWRLAGLLAHEVAQPAAAAALALDLAAVLRARGEAGADAPVEAAARHLAQLQSVLRAVSLAAGGVAEEPAADPADALLSVLPFAVIRASAPAAGGAVLAPALRRIARSLAADEAMCRRSRGAVRLSLSGPGAPDEAARAWAAALARVGVRVRWARAGGRARAVLVCPERA